MVGRSPFRRHQVRQDEAEAVRASQPRGSSQQKQPGGGCAASLCPTRTGAGVVPEAVGSPVAQWAEAIGACNREPEPHAEQEGGLQVQPQCLGRAGGQPRTSPGLLQKPQVGPLCFAGSGDGQGWASWALSREAERSCCLGGRTVAAVMRSAASTAALNRSTEAVVVGQSVA